MHRDVSPSNILIMSTSPPLAILCDYGKAVKAPKAFETTIGPIPFLAPEVGEPNGYTNKIDIWGVGIVCCWILFPNAISDHITKKKRPDTKFVATMLGMLSDYKGKGKQEKSFAHLIEKMLQWRSGNRITVGVPLISFTQSLSESLSYLLPFEPTSSDPTFSLVRKCLSRFSHRLPKLFSTRFFSLLQHQH